MSKKQILKGGILVIQININLKWIPKVITENKLGFVIQPFWLRNRLDLNKSIFYLNFKTSLTTWKILGHILLVTVTVSYIADTLPWHHILSESNKKKIRLESRQYLHLIVYFQHLFNLIPTNSLKKITLNYHCSCCFWGILDFK